MEGRARLFVYPETRKFIKEKCVPVVRSALHSSGYETDDKFWDKLSKQGAQLGNSIGVMCTASGKLLADKDANKAMEAWSKLPASERKPGGIQIEERGPFNPRKGVKPPPNGLIVKVFLRELQRDDKGHLFAPRVRSELQSGGKRYEILEEPNRDFLWLTDAETKALAPKKMTKGDKYPFPKSVQERIVRFHLTDFAKGLQSPWQPEQIRSEEMTLTVEEVSTDVARIRLDGSVFIGDKTKATYYLDGKLLGYLSYDAKEKAIKKFDVVCLASYKGERGENAGASGPVKTEFGYAFELGDAKSTATIVPPRGTRLVNGSSASFEDYFHGAPGTLRASASQSQR
jgi:hypothetical protein